MSVQCWHWHSHIPTLNHVYCQGYKSQANLVVWNRDVKFFSAKFELCKICWIRIRIRFYLYQHVRKLPLYTTTETGGRGVNQHGCKRHGPLAKLQWTHHLHTLLCRILLLSRDDEITQRCGLWKKSQWQNGSRCLSVTDAWATEQQHGYGASAQGQHWPAKTLPPNILPPNMAATNLHWSEVPLHCWDWMVVICVWNSSEEFG